MKNAGKYAKGQQLADMLLAYKTFMDSGIEAVERIYPQYRSFVLTHKGKSLTQVKEELLHELATC
jgi:hypothetical protein